MGVANSLTVTLDGAVLLAIEVQPGAHRQGVTGFNAWRNRLSVAVKADAKQGQANLAVVHVLAQQLSLPSGKIRIVSGERSRLKSVRVEGVGADDLLVRLRSLVEEGS